MTVPGIIFRNLIGYDLLIFAAAALNAGIFLLTRRRALALYRRLHLVIFLPTQPMEGGAVVTSSRSFAVEELVKLREEAESLYALFSNLTAIFPLLGILGTVISLLPMVADMGNLENNFFAALTSTFWGLVFAIAFKLCDAFLSARMEDNDKNVALLLNRMRERPEPEAETADAV